MIATGFGSADYVRSVETSDDGDRTRLTMGPDRGPDLLPPDVSKSASRDAKLRLGLAALGVVLVVVLIIYWIAPI